MEFKEPKPSSNEIPPSYQEAFAKLGQELIFTKPVGEKINRNTAAAISRKIQDEMVDMEDDNQIKMRSYVTNQIVNLSLINTETGEIKKTETDEQESKYVSVFDQYQEKKMGDEEFLKTFTDFYVDRPVYDASHQYDGWGFTPKLIKELDEDWKDAGLHKIKRNCFGNVIGLGAYYRKRGLRFDMGITADHPYAVVYLDSGTYLADIGGVRKIQGEIEDHGTYKMYRPTAENGIVSHMILIHNFDDGVLYEILENMEVLRRMSLGKDVVNLPNTREDGLKIAEAHKETLQQINWKDLQSKLFPGIASSFADNKEAWGKEIEDIAKERPMHYAQKVFFDALKKAQWKTTFAGTSFPEGQQALLKEFETYQDKIVAYVRDDVPFDDSVSENTKNFFVRLKEEIAKEKDPHIIELVNEIIAKRIIDKQNKSDTNTENNS